jgi:hypothetical protein
MHTDMIRRNKVKITGMIAATCLAGLCLVACDREESLGEKPEKPGSTELCFAAALEGSQSTKTIGKPDVLEGTVFPLNGTYIFGMFITDDSGAGLPDGTQSNMKTTLTRGAAAGEDTWTHTTSGDTDISPKAEPAQSINIYGYYPWVAGATATAVPFDLTGSMNGKKELLYLSLPASPITMPADGNIALTFSHAYCWVKVKLTRLSDLNEVAVKSVSIDNLHANLSWIKNKGTINPKTGEVNTVGFTAGPLEVNCSPAEDVPIDGSLTALPLEFDFLVPSFLGRVKDGEVVIRIMTSDDKVLTFPLTRNNLNGDDDVSTDDIYGFRKGWKNEYNIIYNNAAMILELSDWQSYPINGSLGVGMEGYTPLRTDYVAGSAGNAKDYYNGMRPFGVTNIGDTPNPNNHLFHTYLGEVANGNNGSYLIATVDLGGSLITAWRATGSQERINPQLMLARAWGAGGAPVPWKDPATGVLVARQACASLREGGYKDWRLPRINELYVINQRIIDQGGGMNSSLEYWSGTESGVSAAWVLTKGATVAWLLPYPREKTIPLYVRCVRDATKPK